MGLQVLITIFISFFIISSMGVSWLICTHTQTHTLTTSVLVMPWDRPGRREWWRMTITQQCDCYIFLCARRQREHCYRPIKWLSAGHKCAVSFQMGKRLEGGMKSLCPQVGSVHTDWLHVSFLVAHGTRYHLLAETNRMWIRVSCFAAAFTSLSGVHQSPVGKPFLLLNEKVSLIIEESVNENTLQLYC